MHGALRLAGSANSLTRQYATVFPPSSTSVIHPTPRSFWSLVLDPDALVSCRRIALFRMKGCAAWGWREVARLCVCFCLGAPRVAGRISPTAHLARSEKWGTLGTHVSCPEITSELLRTKAELSNGIWELVLKGTDYRFNYS